MVSQAKGGCKVCGSKSHTKMYHNEKKPLKRTAIKRSVVAPVKKRKTKTPRAKAKENAWKAFGYYIRIRDSLATTGTTTHCVCVTCRERGDSTPKEFSHIQAGHAVGGRGNAVLFHEEIVNGQCDYCNRNGQFGLSGDYGNYALFLVRKYGVDHAAELQRLKGTDKVYKTHHFLEIEQEYKMKVAKLLEEQL